MVEEAKSSTIWPVRNHLLQFMRKPNSGIVLIGGSHVSKGNLDRWNLWVATTETITTASDLDAFLDVRLISQIKPDIYKQPLSASIKCEGKDFEDCLVLPKLAYEEQADESVEYATTSLLVFPNAVLAEYCLRATKDTKDGKIAINGYLASIIHDFCVPECILQTIKNGIKGLPSQLAPPRYDIRSFKHYVENS